MADHHHGAEGIAATYGHTWVIRTDLAIGVAAYRRIALPPAEIGERVNVLVATDLDGLITKLDAQEQIPMQGRLLPPRPLALVAAPASCPRPTGARPQPPRGRHTQG